MYFITALICTLSWGAADLFYKKSSSENDSYSHLKIAIWVGITMGISSFILIPFCDEGLAILSIKNLIKYSPASLGYIISMVVGYAGMRYLEISIISPVQNSSGALSAIAMTIFYIICGSSFKEAIFDGTGIDFSSKNILSITNSILVILGIVLCVLGVILLAIEENKKSKEEKKKYRMGALALIFPLLYCLFDTIGTAADGIILDDNKGFNLGEIEVLILYGFTFFIIGICCYLFLTIKTKKIYNPIKNKNAMISSFFEEGGQIFYVFAMASKPVLAAPLIASYCIFSCILSRIFLKEKLNKHQTIFILMVIVGIISLGVSEGIQNI